jgi:predicted RNase H-like HicB family nuclease
VVKEEDGGYSGRCIEYPGAISQGETLPELRKNMKEAINLIRQSYEKELMKIISEEYKQNQLIEVAA